MYQRPNLPIWKKALFSLLVCATVFGFIEALLALLGVESTAQRDPYVGFEGSSPLMVQRLDDRGQVLLATAANKLAFFNAQQFPKQKDEQTFRIFCLGGSTTFGHPYDDRTSFVGWLREFLPAVDSSKHWEVINAGGVSYASYRVAHLMEELAHYDPDLFIIYTGHNEFLEERTYQELAQTPAGVRKAQAWLSHTRLYRALDAAWHDRARGGARSMLPGEVDAILDHTSGPTSYQRDAAQRRKTLEHLHFNLGRMTEIARSAGADILFVVPAVNLQDCSPFKSEHDEGLNQAQRDQWRALFEQGQQAEEQQQLEAALVAYRQAAMLDDRFALLHYRLGHVLQKQGQYEEARIAFQRAVDEDVCSLRATSEIQATIERVAVNRGVPLVDAGSILDHDCQYHYGHRSPGAEYFLDHVHPTIATNGLIAQGILAALAQRKTVQSGAQLDEQTIATVARRIEGRVDAELQARALRNLAQVLSWAGKKQAAGALADQAVRLREKAQLPDDPESLFHSAVQLAMSGQNQRAIDLLRKVVSHEPENAEAQWRLGQLLYDEQQFDDALLHFEAAIQADSDNAYALQMAGALRARAGQVDTALVYYRRAYKLTPADYRLHQRMAAAYQQSGRENDAIKWYQRAVHFNRDALLAHQQLAQLLTKRGQAEEAAHHWQEVLRLDPHSETVPRQLRKPHG